MSVRPPAVSACACFCGCTACQLPAACPAVHPPACPRCPAHASPSAAPLSQPLSPPIAHLRAPLPRRHILLRCCCRWTPRQVYDVVAAVEHYHRFVPWCQRSAVLVRRGAPPSEYLEAELEVGFQMFVER